MQMVRITAASLAVGCCVAAVGGIAYLHGFERALGEEAWERRPELIGVYSSGVVFRAGPCGLFALASVGTAFAARSRGLSVAVAGVAVLVSAVSLAGTYFTTKAYIRAWGGHFLPTSPWDGVSLILWLVAFVVVLACSALALVRLARNPAGPGAAAGGRGG